VCISGWRDHSRLVVATNDQRCAMRTAEDFLGDAAIHPAAESRTPVARHDDQVDATLVDSVDDKGILQVVPESQPTLHLCRCVVN
jgi:hypothetical protein